MITHGKIPKRRTRTNIHMFSARKKAFLYYETDLDPSWVAALVGISLATARRYHASWSKLPRGLNQELATARVTWRVMSIKERTAFAKVISSKLKCNPEDILNRMGRPWALRDLLTGKWMSWDVSDTPAIHHSEITSVSRIQKFMQTANVKRLLDLVWWGEKPI